MGKNGPLIPDTLYPVLLAGGSGSRLWPLSRASFPKQFSSFFGDKTLFQQCALRLVTSQRLNIEKHIIMTNAEFRFIVEEQLHAVGIDPSSIVIEPQVKNTAAAVLSATLIALSKDPEAMLIIAPSDHMIPDHDKFHDTIMRGINEAKKGKIVTFGISPTHPNTGYGYLEIPNDGINKDEASKVLRFIEKPDLSRAEQMLEGGNFLWNAGIYLFKAINLIEAFEHLAPEMLKLGAEAVAQATTDLGFMKLDTIAWNKIEDISLDYAIMEKISNLVVIPYSSNWSDLGGWDSIWSETPKDSSGNAVSEGAFNIDCNNTLLRSDDPNQKIVGLGLDNILAISMMDAVIVLHKDRAQDVKQVVELLDKNNVEQAKTFSKNYRPWGWYESVSKGEGFQVKRIFVKPHGRLSLQSHQHRSEHWVVVTGTAEVTVGNEVSLVPQGESIFVPKEAVHRLGNPGKTTLEIIEIQIGPYLGEDDIIRYDDQYGRN